MAGGILTEFPLTPFHEEKITKLWSMGIGDSRIGVVLKIPSGVVRDYINRNFEKQTSERRRALRRSNGIHSMMKPKELLSLSAGIEP